MKKNFLFTSLSLISSFSKYHNDDPISLKGSQIEKNNTFTISGNYSVINDFVGISVKNTGTEDYFYTFDVEPDTKIYKGKEEVDFSKIQEGDKLKVTYDGSVSLVYPPKLNNVTKIEIDEK